MGYLRTLAPGLTWLHNGADGGDLAAAVAALGVPHPTGYPTYVLLGRAFALLPMGDVAWRLNLMSAACAAMACAIVALLVMEMAPGRGAAVASATGALLLAFCPIFWGQSVITEVHTLNALFVAVLLWLAWRRAAPGLIGLLLGLGLGNHVTLMLLVPSLLILRGRPATGWRRGLAGALAGLAIGLSVYLYLPWRAAAHPTPSWGDAHTLDGFLWLVTGQAYSHYLLAAPAAETLARLPAWAALLAQQFTWVGLALALWGLSELVSSPSKRIAPVPAATGLAALLYSAYALVYDTADSYLYLIPAFLVLAIWLGVGLSTILAAAQRAWPGWAPVMALCLLALPAAQYAANMGGADASGDVSARRFTEQAGAVLAPDALVLTASDDRTFALWYWQGQAGRSDLVIADRDLAQYPWYRRQVGARGADLALAPDNDDPAEYITGLVAAAQAGRPIYLASEDSALLAAYRWQQDGALWRLAPPAR